MALGLIVRTGRILTAKLLLGEQVEGITHCAIGDGVNANNIVKCLELLKGRDFEGVLSMECEGAGGPMIEKSLKWLRGEIS